jgi:FMN phosphatase YigB (HAD superfamily)
MTAPTLFSYDVFDTAITRLVIDPDHLHWAVGARLRAQGVVLIGEEPWRAARREAEDGLRRRTSLAEITLDEIYAELATIIPLTPTQMLNAMTIEVEEETRLVRPVKAIKDKIWKDAEEGQQQCFISDTYLTANQVKKLLGNCGYGPLTIHASSEYRKTKARGDLFAAVGAYHNVPCKHIAHIGDNAVSDVSRARGAGCDATLFKESQPTQREHVLFAAGTPGFLSSAVAGAARAARLGYTGSCSEGMRTASTSAVGPVLTAYVLWVLQDVIKRGGRTVYFLARDGQILQRICARLVDYLKVDINPRYLIGSRKAFFLAVLPSDLKAAVTSAFANAPNETVLSILIALGFSATECASIVSEAGASADRLARTISEDEVRDLYLSISSIPQRGADLVDRIMTARAAARQYFAQEGLFESGTAYVVDIGWHGNLQLRMQHIVGDQTKLMGYYVRLYRTPDKISDAVNNWTADDWPRAALLEVFTLADHSSVQGFGFDSTNQAVCSPPLEEARELVEWGVRHQHELVDLFLRNLLEAVDPAIFEPEMLAAALTECGVAAFVDFVRFPTRAEGETYGGIALPGDQNHLDAKEIAPAISNFDAIRMLGDSESRRARTDWFQGSLARSSDKMAPAALRAISSAIARFR